MPESSQERWSGRALIVGAGGIGEQLKVVIGWRHGDDVFAIICLLVATIIALDYLSQYVRHRLSGLR